MKRQPSFPFTFDQKLRSDDKRELIQTDGFKRLYIKHKLLSQSNSSRTMTAVGYRNNGNVTLGISTIFNSIHWDLILKDSRDAHRMRKDNWLASCWENCSLQVDADEKEEDHHCPSSDDEENFSDESSFTLHTTDEEIRLKLSCLPIRMLTTDQNSQGWFLLRSFSFTSSTVDSIVEVAHKYFSSLSGSTIPADEKRMFQFARSIFSYICGNSTSINSNEEETSAMSDNIDATNHGTFIIQ